MDTSKNYYETVMRDFAMYARGRTLEQYCRIESVDYKWPLKAKRKYSGPTQPEKPEEVTDAESILYIKWFDNRKFLKPVSAQ